jgi:hypothetical protein
MTEGKFSSVGNFNADAVYESSLAFKGVPNETLYLDALDKIDKRESKKGYLEKYIKEIYDSIPMVQKATLSTAITAPTIIDADIIDRVRREMPVIELIPRRTNRGKVASYNAETVRSSGAFLSEGASLNDQDDTYANNTANIKYSYVVGGVTGPAQAHEAHYIDLWAEVIRSKTLALKELHEQTFLTGSTSTDNQYDGLNNLITTNTQAKSTTNILLDDVGTNLDSSRAYGGRGKKIAITDYTTLRDIKSQMMASVHYIDKNQIAWGLTAVTYEDLPIVPSRFSNTTSGSKRFYIVDTEVTEFRVLQEPVMEELAKTADHRRFFVKEYSVPIIKHEARCAMITGLK